MRPISTLVATALTSLALVSCYATMADEAAGGGGGEGGAGGAGGEGGGEVVNGNAIAKSAASLRAAANRAPTLAPSQPHGTTSSTGRAGRAGHEHAAGAQLVARDDRPSRPTSDLPPNLVGPIAALPPPRAASLTTPDLGRETTLTNNPALCPHAWIAPLPGEESQLAVTRLTPSAYPFEVRRVRYKLDNGGLKEGRLTCSAGWNHVVEIFAGEGATPPGRPQVLARWHVKGVQSNDPIVAHDLALDAPVTLEEGQHLFIAVSAGGRYPNTLCLAACGGASVDADRNYWSKEGPPYPWPTLSSFNLDYSFQFEALGAVKRPSLVTR